MILGIMELAAYYFGGIFKIDGISPLNYQEGLEYIFLHPLQNWMNEYTPAVLGIAFILWLMIVSYYLTYYRNFQFDKEHGTAEWGDVGKIGKRLQCKNETASEFNTHLSRNISFSSKALSNMNILCIGGSGSGKSTSLVVPNILKANCTNVILDIKGDLLKKYGAYLKQKGVAVKSLNFKNPLESDRYNPFQYVKDESDLIGLITNIQASVRPPDAMRSDPFWDDGVRLYLLSMFEYEYLKGKRDPKYKTGMNHILDLVNKETIKIDEDGTTLLQKEMDGLAREFGPNYPPVRDYRKLKEGATETVRSIIIMVNAQLQLFELPEIKRIFEDDDIDIPSLGLGVGGNPNKKTALFLVMRSRDTSYNLFINMFYTQMYRVLCDIADNDCINGELPIHVRLWADEFYAGPKPPETETLLGEIRSRNMSIVPILQDLAQIKTLFPNDKWEIFNGNCATMIYMGSGPSAHSTHQWISEMLDKATIDSRDESIGHGQGGSNLRMSKAGASLMTTNQIREMPGDDCVIFLEREKPIYDKKNIPWKYKNPEWMEAERIRGDGYIHPVRVVFNEKELSYRTIVSSSKIEFIDKRDYKFYEEAAKTDPSIRLFTMDEKDFLYLNWNAVPKPTEEEVAELFRECVMKKEIDEKLPPPEDVEQSYTYKEADWDLSGSIVECLLRYADQLTKEEQEAIVAGIEAGLKENQIKKYFALHDAVKMNQYRRAFQFSNSI